ncbi:MAG: DUF459 domain-containing protein [Acidobacteriota bacterium]
MPAEEIVAPTTPPAVPEQATKQALEPKLARNAALTPPRSEPVPAAPEPASSLPATAPDKPEAAAPSSEEPAPKATTGKLEPAAPSPQAKTPPTEQASLTARAKGKADLAAPSPEAPASKGEKGKTGDRAVAVVGDSLAVGVGMTMEQRLKKTEGYGCLPMGKVSTGLISKKYDWDKALADLLAKRPISAVVVVLGGNDANNSIGGKATGTAEWNAAYAAKVERFLRIAEGAHVKVMWVGLPAMQEAAYSKRVEAVNAAAKSACLKVSGCSYLEASDLFTDGSGNYVQAKNIGGKTVALRAADGVHMTMTGYDLLCRRVIDKLELTGGKSRE